MTITISPKHDDKYGHTFKLDWAALDRRRARPMSTHIPPEFGGCTWRAAFDVFADNGKMSITLTKAQRTTRARARNTHTGLALNADVGGAKVAPILSHNPRPNQRRGPRAVEKGAIDD